MREVEHKSRSKTERTGRTLRTKVTRYIHVKTEPEYHTTCVGFEEKQVSSFLPRPPSPPSSVTFQ